MKVDCCNIIGRGYAAVHGTRAHYYCVARFPCGGDNVADCLSRYEYLSYSSQGDSTNADVDEEMKVPAHFCDGNGGVVPSGDEQPVPGAPTNC